MSDIFKNRFVTLSRIAWNWWGIEATTGYYEHRPYLRFAGFGFWLSFNLPLWVLQPQRLKIKSNGFIGTGGVPDALGVGHQWYWAETRREYGLDFHKDAFTLHYGIQPGCSPGDKTVHWTPPWMRWRHLGTRYFGLDGSVFLRLSSSIFISYEEKKTLEATVPTMRFAFDDIDGERIEATVRMEESEFACGEGRWHWLSHLRPHRFHPRCDIEFSKESGRGKGSWKGGCTASNSPSKHGEMHEAAFRRYCADNRMTFISVL